jgi:hypothetical protein
MAIAAQEEAVLHAVMERSRREREANQSGASSHTTRPIFTFFRSSRRQEQTQVDSVNVVDEINTV